MTVVSWEAPRRRPCEPTGPAVAGPMAGSGTHNHRPWLEQKPSATAPKEQPRRIGPRVRGDDSRREFVGWAKAHLRRAHHLGAKADGGHAGVRARRRFHLSPCGRGIGCLRRPFLERTPKRGFGYVASIDAIRVRGYGLSRDLNPSPQPSPTRGEGARERRPWRGQIECMPWLPLPFSPCGRRWRVAPDEGSVSAETTPPSPTRGEGAHRRCGDIRKARIKS